MDEAGLVQGGERVGDVDRNLHGPPRVQGPAANQLIQPLAGHVLEREEHLPVLEAALVEHRDARMRDGLQRLGGGLQGHGAFRVR